MDYESKDKGQKGSVRYVHTENTLNTDRTHKIRSCRPKSRVAVKKDFRRAEQKKDPWRGSRGYCRILATTTLEPRNLNKIVKKKGYKGG